MPVTRAELFRLLGDEGRLRLLALASEDELTVGELATLLGESQPQVTKKSQPLREVGLLAARRDGTRTLLSTQPSEDPVVEAALEEGRLLCSRDGSLSRVAAVIAQREEASRRFFEQAASAHTGEPAIVSELASWLPILGPLLPGRSLAVDLGTGDGSLLPILSPLYDRVIAVDRSASRLARCSARIAAWGLPNVRLREGDADDANLLADVDERGGADLVVMARMLHHAARPQDALSAATRLLRPGGYLLVVDYLPHGDEALRDQGDVWLGFEPAKLRTWIDGARLELVSLSPVPQLQHPAPHQLAVGRKPPRLTSTSQALTA